MEGLERAIYIIEHQIMKRESKRENPKYLLKRNLLKEEIKSLDKALTLVKNNSVLLDVSNCDHEREIQKQGDGFVYTTCLDCGEDLD